MSVELTHSKFTFWIFLSFVKWTIVTKFAHIIGLVIANKRNSFLSGLYHDFSYSVILSEIFTSALANSFLSSGTGRTFRTCKSEKQSLSKINKTLIPNTEDTHSIGVLNIITRCFSSHVNLLE